jgi:hypothetical protein
MKKPAQAKLGRATLRSKMNAIGWSTRRSSDKKLRHTSGAHPTYVWSYGDSDELGSGSQSILAPGPRTSDNPAYKKLSRAA